MEGIPIALEDGLKGVHPMDELKDEHPIAGAVPRAGPKRMFDLFEAIVGSTTSLGEAES